MKRTSILLISGGQSAEHEVSLRSADFVRVNLDKKKYRLIDVVIGRDGKWRSRVADKKEGECILRHTSGSGQIHFLDDEPPLKIDVVFPIIHGSTGEDGCLQGLLEFAGLPYVGCGVLGSAIGMDKILQKSALRDAGFDVTDFVGFDAADWRDSRAKILSKASKLRGPWFVKPSAQGSSVGISKVSDKKKLAEAIDHAFQFDTRVLVESAVQNPRELEVAVVVGDHGLVTQAAEILSQAEFYDYDAKYVSSETQVIIPAKISKKLEKKLQGLAEGAAKTLAVDGYARVDFLVERGTEKVFVNEINTAPGMTSASAFPRLCETAGVSGSELVDRLIEGGLAKFNGRRKLKLEK